MLPGLPRLVHRARIWAARILRPILHNQAVAPELYHQVVNHTFQGRYSSQYGSEHSYVSTSLRII